MAMRLSITRAALWALHLVGMSWAVHHTPPAPAHILGGLPMQPVSSLPPPAFDDTPARPSHLQDTTTLPSYPSKPLAFATTFTTRTGVGQPDNGSVHNTRASVKQSPTWPGVPAGGAAGAGGGAAPPVSRVICDTSPPTWWRRSARVEKVRRSTADEEGKMRREGRRANRKGKKRRRKKRKKRTRRARVGRAFASPSTRSIYRSGRRRGRGDNVLHERQKSESRWEKNGWNIEEKREREDESERKRKGQEENQTKETERMENEESETEKKKEEDSMEEVMIKLIPRNEEGFPRRGKIYRKDRHNNKESRKKEREELKTDLFQIKRIIAEKHTILPPRDGVERENIRDAKTTRKRKGRMHPNRRRKEHNWTHRKGTNKSSMSKMNTKERKEKENGKSHKTNAKADLKDNQTLSTETAPPRHIHEDHEESGHNNPSSFFLPSELLTTHTLSWLPYNPNIRVSIQVLDDTKPHSDLPSQATEDDLDVQNPNDVVDSFDEDIDLHSQPRTPHTTASPTSSSQDTPKSHYAKHQPERGTGQSEVTSGEQQVTLIKNKKRQRWTKKKRARKKNVEGKGKKERGNKRESSAPHQVVSVMKVEGVEDGREEGYGRARSGIGNHRVPIVMLEENLNHNGQDQRPHIMVETTLHGSPAGLDNEEIQEESQEILKDDNSKVNLKVIKKDMHVRGSTDLDRAEDGGEEKQDEDKQVNVKVEDKEVRSTRDIVISLAQDVEGLLQAAPKHQDAYIEDGCLAWSRCRVERALQEISHLSTLPSCPCFYPADLPYKDAIHDPVLNATFRWMSVSGMQERLDIYHRGAHLCIRSHLPPHPRSLAAQTCCYNRERQLVTRGSGAGTPALVSPEVNPNLHRKVDLIPWLGCRGNFLRYQAVRPPNNKQNCRVIPSDQTFRQQVFLATDY